MRVKLTVETLHRMLTLAREQGVKIGNYNTMQGWRIAPGQSPPSMKQCNMAIDKAQEIGNELERIKQNVIAGSPHGERPDHEPPAGDDWSPAQEADAARPAAPADRELPSSVIERVRNRT